MLVPKKNTAAVVAGSRFRREGDDALYHQPAREASVANRAESVYTFRREGPSPERFSVFTSSAAGVSRMVSNSVATPRTGVCEEEQADGAQRANTG